MSLINLKTTTDILEEITISPYSEAYSFESLKKENKDASASIIELLNICFNNNKACIMTVYGQEAHLLEFYVCQLLKENNMKLKYYFPKNTEKSFDINDFLENDSTEETETNKEEENLSETRLVKIVSNENVAYFNNTTNLLNTLNTPVILLTDPFEYTKNKYSEENTDHDWDFTLSHESIELRGILSYSLLNIKLKTPAQNEYEKQLKLYLKNFINFPSKLIDFCIKEFKVNNINPKLWDKYAFTISQVKEASEKTLSKIISAGKDNSATESKIRKNSHYDMQILQTSPSISEVIKIITNAQTYCSEYEDSDINTNFLLYGIPGTGKTSFVEEIAKQLHKPIINARASDFLRSHVGETEHNIKLLFEDARKTDSILLFDEAESLLQDRTSLKYNWEIQMVNEFMVNMECFEGILFCCTNHPEIIDDGIKRRFQTQVEFKNLGKNEIRTLAENYFPKHSFTETQINKVYNAGPVCPGDFRAVHSKYVISDSQQHNSDFVTNELVNFIEHKGKSRKIGFGC